MAFPTFRGNIMNKNAAAGLRPYVNSFLAHFRSRLRAPAAPAQSSAQVSIETSVERVWQVLADIERWPSWNQAVETAKLQGGVAPGSVFVWKSQGYTVRSTLQAVAPGQRLTWTGAAFGTRAFHSWDLEATDGGVLVTTRESFDGWLPRLFPQAMQRKLEDTLPRWLAALKAAAERSTTSPQSPSGLKP